MNLFPLLVVNSKFSFTFTSYCLQNTHNDHIVKSNYDVRMINHKSRFKQAWENPYLNIVN